MSKPLLITDCDEVLLFMVKHFGDWLDSVHAIDFRPQVEKFSEAMRYRDTGILIPQDQMWDFLNEFFDREMDRQTLVPHALPALEQISETADIVILTNLLERHVPARIAQLDRHGIRYRVVSNQGGKGDAVRKLIEEYRPSSTVFVDDLPNHHSSVKAEVPQVWRLHMIADPILAEAKPRAPDAHARIDEWLDAVPWILNHFTQPA